MLWNIIITRDGLMNKKMKHSLGLLVFFITTGAAHAIATAPGVSTNNNNFLGGIVRGQVTKDFHYNTAATVGLEAGPRDYRATGTFGWQADPRQRVKFTGEYLTQDIDYNFYSGVSRQWVQQGAVGLAYQYALNDKFENYLSLSGFYSHAPSKNLSTKTGSFTTSSSTLTNWADMRRIAGSNAGGLSPSITTHLWEGSEATVGINWDDVVYDNRNQPQKKAQGFGASASVSQLLLVRGENFKASASAAARAPFDHYQAEVDWIKPYPTSSLLVGVFGGYVIGKFTLPNTSIVGLNVAYTMDTPAPHNAPAQQANAQTFLSWMGEAAVRMPQVLAIVDENVTQTSACQFAAPTFAGPIADQVGGAPGETFTFNSPTQFTGSNLTYSVSFTATPGALLNTVTINPTTGVLTITGSRVTDTVTITATNPCGATVTSNTFHAAFI